MSSLSPDRRDKIEASRQRELSRARTGRGEKKVDKMVQNILAEKKYKLTAALSAAYNAQASRSPSRPARKARECGLSGGTEQKIWSKARPSVYEWLLVEARFGRGAIRAFGTRRSRCGRDRQNKIYAAQKERLAP